MAPAIHYAVKSERAIILFLLLQQCRSYVEYEIETIMMKANTPVAKASGRDVDVVWQLNYLEL